jgi:hypothetical protein
MCLIAGGFRDHITDHFCNDDPMGWHRLLHSNGFTDGNHSAGFAECVSGRVHERINRQGLIQQIRQDGFPATPGICE